MPATLYFVQNASLPLACHALRRVCSRRDQFYCRWRDAADISSADLARARSARRQRDQHCRTLAGTLRRSIENSSAILFRLGVTSIIGGAFGALLLIRTPSRVFANLVPFLILFATLLFMSHGVINKRLRLGSFDNKPMGLWWSGAMIFQFFSAMYGGYFGAGNGILMLAAMGVLGLNDLNRANGIKNFLGICINSIAVLLFALAGLVVWPDALVMAVGALAGGYFGASMAMRVGQKWVRRGIVLIGLIIFVVMAWRLH
jgi:uncharacterized membrane protein YfcA